MVKKNLNCFLTKKRSIVDLLDKKISVNLQLDLLNLNKSTYYCRSKPVVQESLDILNLYLVKLYFSI